MSAIGPKQTWACALQMSAFGGKADIALGSPAKWTSALTFAQKKVGLGTGIIKALSHQLNAQVETLASPQGTRVSITHATFPTVAVA